MSFETLGVSTLPCRPALDEELPQEVIEPSRKLTVLLHPLKNLPKHDPRPGLLLLAGLAHVGLPELIVDREVGLEVVVQGIGGVLEAGEGGGEEVGCRQGKRGRGKAGQRESSEEGMEGDLE